MNTEKLVRMANQIADNFDYGSDRNRAVDGVLDHLTRFWTPEMKQAIVEYQRKGPSGAQSSDDSGLNEIASGAVVKLGENLDAAA
jgi:formate dehydrogenase subunit delta